MIENSHLPVIGHSAFRSVGSAADPKAEQAISRQAISRQAIDGARVIAEAMAATRWVCQRPSRHSDLCSQVITAGGWGWKDQRWPCPRNPSHVIRSAPPDHLAEERTDIEAKPT
jgi:hypothetical protein